MTLQSCLRSYFMPETMHGHQCSRCGAICCRVGCGGVQACYLIVVSCKSTVGSMKTIRLTRLPSLMCLHLQRRAYGPFGMYKDNRRVT